MLKPFPVLIVAFAITFTQARIGDITVKFFGFECMKEEESKYCRNISCKMKPINRTTTTFSGLCYDPGSWDSMTVKYLQY